MKRGMHKESYVYHNGKYLFRAQEGVRPNIAYYPGTNILIKRKRTRNRGNHFDSTYGNLRGGVTHPFKAHNDKKALLRIKKILVTKKLNNFCMNTLNGKRTKD
jgi:hypothetical protein